VRNERFQKKSIGLFNLLLYINWFRRTALLIDIKSIRDEQNEKTRNGKGAV